MADDDRKQMISRIGTFFILLGILGLILFVVSDLANKTDFSFFIPGLLLLIIGFVIKRASSAPSLPNKRFEGIRKWQQRQRESKTKNDKNKNDKTQK